MNCLSLNNGVVMPQLGIGTWQINGKDNVERVLAAAYNTGFRMIDTAAAYSNEIAIGGAIKRLGINRGELFISDKVWNTSRTCETVLGACRSSLKKLKTDYIDLYLVHWPASPKLHEKWADINAEVWRGMEKCLTEGYVRAIGVCNFKVNHLNELIKTAVIIPALNQLEIHPGMEQPEITWYCKETNIMVEASSPLGNGKILDNNTLREIAGKYGKTPAQICIRWCLEKGFAVIPKTTNGGRMAENIDVFDFEIQRDDIERIDKIPYCGGIGFDSDEVIQFG